MVYRIRYIQSGLCQQAIETIEANSPTEAMVKFRVSRSEVPSNSEDIVCSVTAEDDELVSQPAPGRAW